MKTYSVKNFITGKHIGYIDLGFTPVNGDPIEVKSMEPNTVYLGDPIEVKNLEPETVYLEIADLHLVPDSTTNIQGILFGKIITKDRFKKLVQEQLIKELKKLKVSNDKPKSKSKGQVICRRHRPIPGMKDQIRYRVVEVINSIDIVPETSYTLPELKKLIELYPHLGFVFLGWGRT